MAAQAFGGAAQVAILRQILAAGGGDLHQHHLAAVLRVARKQRLVGAQALGDALAVVEPVDADDQRAVAQGAVHGRELAPPFGRGDKPLDLLDVDADRAGVDLDRPLADAEPVALERLGAQLAAGIVGEMLAVGRRLKPDDVVGAQVRRQLAMPRHGGVELGGRERDVQEEAEPAGESQTAQFGRQRDQVEVLHPDAVVGLQESDQPLGEQSGNVAIGLVPFVLERGQVDPVMEQRPQRAIGHAAE